MLDADNALFPGAVAECLALAGASDPQLAVVHPLLAVEAEPGRLDDQRTLVSSASWQRERLFAGNVVDAMALVSRSAWEAVGDTPTLRVAGRTTTSGASLWRRVFTGSNAPESWLCIAATLSR